MNQATIARRIIWTLTALLAAPPFADPPIPAGAPADGGQSPQALIDIRAVQLNEPVKEMIFRSARLVFSQPKEEGATLTADRIRVTASPGRDAAATASPPDELSIPVSPPAEKPELGVTIITVAGDATIKIGDDVLHLGGDRFFQPFDALDRPSTGSDEAWQVLCAPKILVATGRQGKIAVGSTVPYMIQRDDGSLVVKETQDAFEGLAIGVLVERVDETGVMLRNFQVELSSVVGRQEIPGIPFDVGRPVIRSMKISSTLLLGGDQIAIISLPRQTEENPPIFVFLTARRVEPNELHDRKPQ